MGLGPLHTVDLEEAREKARGCRRLLMAGKDPLAERDGAKVDQDIASSLAKTVNQVLDEYWDAKIAHKSKHLIKHAQYLLKKYVREKIGDMPIQKIDTKIILDAVGLRTLWIEQNPTAVILHNHLKRMFSFAIASRYYRGDNPAAWKDRLEHVLPPSKDVHNVTHYAYVAYKDVGRFMAKLRAWEDGSSRRHGHTGSALLLEFVILTGVRLSEARLATWKEFDLQGQSLKENEPTICPVPDTEKLFRGRVVQQPVILGFHRSVAFAGGVLEPLQIEDLDVPAAVTDEAGPLEGGRNWRYAAPAYAEHLSEKFLGQCEGIAAGQIA
jgi:hypothetical protein